MDLINKKQELVREIVQELKHLTQESGEEEILALLNNETEMPFGAWVVECSDWYDTIKELAKEEEEDIEDVIDDVKHEVFTQYVYPRTLIFLPS